MRKIIVLLTILFNIDSVLTDGYIYISTQFVSAQQMSYEGSDDYGYDNTKDGGTIPDVEVIGNLPDFEDLWGTIISLQEWINSLNNANINENTDENVTNNNEVSSESIEDSNTTNKDKDKGTYNKKHVPMTNEVDLRYRDLNYYLPEFWRQQIALMDCFTTVMEYVSNYYSGTLFENYCWNRISFEEDYLEKYGRDIAVLGLLPKDVENFFDLIGFYYNRIECNQIPYYISNGYPVISTIENSVGKHEILIIGYTDNNLFVVVDPSNGRITYRTKKGLSDLFAITGYRIYK